ncbi:hypothetical protein DVA67_011485 [Solirubrobacter sp. CPCC 204708]|uniref:Transcriptional regulator n=1 Tax=Solirubrobacter deserti TaxID=2282478 RepID=A0ABT4RVE0_9ACTN|nr:hypothetical protein [Solirubrobacter deserti]MBE2316601.1 hypothetical protein [Solirubrobacter deserti]MDA0142554.1 hypothetical protein [Solirubrobacter deserti]
MPRPTSAPLSDGPSPDEDETLLRGDLHALVAVGLVEVREEPQGLVYALTDLGRHTPEFGA